MSYFSVWLIGAMFILMMAFVGLIYTIAWIIDFVWRDGDDYGD